MYIEERVRKRTDECKEVTWKEYKGFLDCLDLIENSDKELFNKYVVAPAASKHHGAYECGLVDHSLNVAINLLEWRAKHPDCKLTKSDCIFLGMFHDLCKADTYSLNDDGTITYDKELIKHHALRTIQLCKKFGLKLKTKHKVMILLHMSSWENEEDLKALTLRDRLWLMNPKHVQLVQAMNWADMTAAKQEELKGERKTMNEKDKSLPMSKTPESLFGSVYQRNSFLNYFIEFAKSKFDDEAKKAKLDEIVDDFWQYELFN